MQKYICLNTVCCAVRFVPIETPSCIKRNVVNINQYDRPLVKLYIRLSDHFFFVVVVFSYSYSLANIGMNHKSITFSPFATKA